MLSLLRFLTVNPLTGDNSDTGLIIGLIIGGVCVLAVVAMSVLPKLTRKSKMEDTQSQIEEITEDE